MVHTGTAVQWRAGKFGANLAAFMKRVSYYPLDNGEPTVERITTSVRLPADKHSRIEFLAELWNALDRASGKKNKRKWKPASVIARLVDVGLDGFAEQIGGFPDSQEQRREMLKRAEDVIGRLKK